MNLPFEGEVTAEEKAAIKVTNKGRKGYGIWGQTTGDNDTAGVVGWNNNWVGVWGRSIKHVGVLGESDTNLGVWGKSKTTHGIVGETTGGNDTAGVAGFNDNWVGVWGRSLNKVGVLGEGPIAGRFVGNVEVTGDISLLNADCAEDFDVADSELKENVEAGTVMVLTENGSLQSSYQEYDKKVAGIVSGARGYKPAIVLDRQGQQGESQNNKDRLPIALMGKVYCKVDASHSSIEIGDLLTTSSTKGYAMKVEDPMKGFGAVIGKALGALKEGVGMIPVLVALQ